MADEKTKAEKETPKTPAKVAKSYTVTFSGISDKHGNLRRQSEIVTADELPDPDFQLSIGAIAEVVEAEQAKGESK